MQRVIIPSAPGKGQPLLSFNRNRRLVHAQPWAEIFKKCFFLILSGRAKNAFQILPICGEHEKALTDKPEREGVLVAGTF